MDNLRFQHWLPRDRVFLEEASVLSSTLQAVRSAYAILGDDLCRLARAATNARRAKGIGTT